VDVPDPQQAFRWQDGPRLVVFGRGAAASAGELLEPGYVLLTTERAAGVLPEVAANAGAVHHVGDGRVDELAGDLLDVVPEGARVVALGGGRIVDTAKSVAAARGGRAAAIPTTPSGAEMTGIHRPARGAPEGSGFVRCDLIVNDPLLSASMDVPDLAASALNGLAHAVEGPLTPRANPVSTMAAHAAARLLVDAFAAAPEPDRDAVALGALLAGYTIDSTGYGLHHVISQTLARFTPASHAAANAIVLPYAAEALRRRAPERVSSLDRALAEPIEDAAARLRARTGAERLRDAGVEREALAECADQAAARPDLAGTPPAAEREEILRIYEGAW
jgi:alcohol dehydrogenase class IV